MRQALSCPRCGFLLRFEDPADPSFSPLRYVAVELLPWAALALFFGFLWAPDDVSEWYAAAALVPLALWWRLRARHRAETAALLARRRYRCAQCKAEYTGADFP